MHPHTSLAELAADLGDDTTRLGVLDDEDPAASLPAVLSWSCRALTTEQRTVFGLLGIAPGPDISLPAAASLTCLPLQQARPVLRALEDASLLDQHPGSRYTMHGLIRAYATHTAHHDLPEHAQRAALRRVLDFYTDTAHAADRLLAPDRQPIRLDPPAPGTHPDPLPDAAAALAWFDTEHPNLLAAQHTATTYAWHLTVWQLAWTLAAFHRRRGHRYDRVAVWRAALKAVTHLPDPTTHTITHWTLGGALAEVGRHTEADGYLYQALSLAEHQHDPLQQSRAHHMLSVAWERQGDHRRALEHATQALDLYRTLDRPMWEAAALNMVGWLAAHLGDYDTARAHCHAALTLQQHHHRPDDEAETLDSLGYIAHHTGHHQQSIGYYKQALTLRRELGNTNHYPDTLDGLGHPHAALDQLDQARAVWQEALELYQQQGRDADATRVQRQLNDLNKPGGTENLDE